MSKEYSVVVVGGGLAGTYLALNLIREGLEGGEVALVANEWPPYTKHVLVPIACGEDPSTAYLGVSKELIKSGVKVLNNCLAEGIDLSRNEVRARCGSDYLTIKFKYLVIATGGKAFIPPIKGVNLRGITTLYTLDDATYLSKLRRSSKVLVVGAGLVGTSLTTKLISRGFRVGLIELKDHVLPQVIDHELSKVVEEYLRSLGVVLKLGTEVIKFVGSGRVEGALLSNGFLSTDAVVLTTGVRPNTGLIQGSGIELSGGAVVINDYGMTSVSNVFALGDCALSKDLITGKYVYRPLGFVAAHYAKLIPKYLVRGEVVKDRGVLPTIYEELGGAYVVRVGLSASEANSLGIPAEVRCGKEGNLHYCEVLSYGDLIGWEAVATSHHHVIKSWMYYNEIAGNYG